MKQVYIDQVTWVEPATPVNYVYGRQVDQGQILEIRNMVLHHDGLKTSENTVFMSRYLDHYYPIGEDEPLVVGGYASWDGKIWLGEGFIPCAYVPDSAQNDVLELTVSGVLYDAECWQYEHSLYLMAQK